MMANEIEIMEDELEEIWLSMLEWAAEGRLLFTAVDRMEEEKGYDRILNNEEVKRLAEMMDMPLERERLEREKAFANILFEEKQKGNSCLQDADLRCVYGYAEERENWCFYHDWQALIKSEMDKFDAGLTEKECEESVGSTILRLSDGWYAMSIFGTKYWL